MAEPVLSATLLTPTSVRLTWTALSGDYQIWWRSDHPSGQEFVQLASVVGGSYDVAGLNWTTMYEFKARRISGATYYAFGDILTIFCQCGQGFTSRDTPSNRVSVSWQPSLDIKSDGRVAFAFTARAGESVAIYLWDSGAGWSFFNEFSTTIDVTEPFSIRYEGNKVCLYPFIFWYAKYWTHELLEQVAYHDWEPDSYWAIEGLAVNSDGRVVLIMYKPSANPLFYAAISNDWGVTFTDPAVILEDTTGIDSFYTLASYEEGPDGAIWIAVIRRTGGWSGPGVDRLMIYKYIVGTAPTLMATLGQDLSDWMSSMLIIAVEEDKVGVYCVNDKYAVPTEIPSLAISTDYGSTWELKPLTWVDTGKIAGQITISNGNILVFSRRASDSVPCINRSTDDGDTWTEVYVFDTATWYLPYYAFSSFESAGQYVGFTSCALTLEPEADHNSGFLWSIDSGLTWEWIETPDYLSYVENMPTL